MPGIAETRTYNALLTTTLANYQKKMVDNIFDVYPLLSWLNGKLGEAMRGASVKKTLEGGESIVEHVLYEKNSTVKSYSGAETLDTTLQEGMTIARYEWKQYAGTVGITGRERRANMGEPALIRLLESKTKQTEMSMRDTLSIDAYGDGTGNGSKVLTGLQEIVSATGVLAGINPSTNAWWAAYSRLTAGSFAANGIKYMGVAFDNLSFGNDKPDFIVTDMATYGFYRDAAQPLERLQIAKVADLGFANLAFMTVPILFDRDCTAGYMYFLNSAYINLNVHKDADFKTGEFITPENQDVSTAKILFQGNLSVCDRRKHGVISGFTA